MGMAGEWDMQHGGRGMDGWKEPGRHRMGMELPGPEVTLAQPLRTAVNNHPLPGPAAERGHGALLQFFKFQVAAFWQGGSRWHQAGAGCPWDGRCGGLQRARATGDEKGKGREEDSPPRALTAARSRAPIILINLANQHSQIALMRPTSPERTSVGCSHWPLHFPFGLGPMPGRQGSFLVRTN